MGKRPRLATCFSIDMCDLALGNQRTTYPAEEVVLEIELVRGKLLDRLENL